MKKLMMAVAAVFTVVSMASAATISWSADSAAVDASGNQLVGGTAYLVYLGENGSLDAAFSSGSWNMGDDQIVASTQLYSGSSYAPSSWGFFADSTTVSTGVGAVYAIIVTDKGSAGTELPTEGYYGVSGTYTQQKGGAMDTEDFVYAGAIEVYQEINGGQTPEPPTPAVPEPTTYALVGLAVAALALRKRLSK